MLNLKTYYMKKCVTVLDFLTGEVCVYHYTNKELKKFDDSIEEFIESKNHDINNCQFMCNDSLKLIIR